MEPLFEHRREFGGYETRVLELEGSDRPLLLLHGYADSADTWRGTLTALARLGRPATAVDEAVGLVARDRRQPCLETLRRPARAPRPPGP
jgi:pimeloyl-ACP methyl ester carboxylesterase